MNNYDKIINLCVNEYVNILSKEHELTKIINNNKNYTVKNINNNMYLYKQKEGKCKYIKKITENEINRYRNLDIKRELKETKKEKDKIKKILKEFPLFNPKDDEAFKSKYQHELLNNNDEKFVKKIINEKIIERYYIEEKYFEALYLLSMIKTIKKEAIKKDNKFLSLIDLFKLEEIKYPRDVELLCKLENDNKHKKNALKLALPEFLKHNIVEVNIHNVI